MKQIIGNGTYKLRNGKVAKVDDWEGKNGSTQFPVSGIVEGRYRFCWTKYGREIGDKCLMPYDILID